MSRTTISIAAAAILAATLTACGGSSGGDGTDKSASSTSPSTSSGPKPAAGLSLHPQDAAAAWAKIHAAVPTSGYSRTVTEANDGNHLIGRPHQYTSALDFTDSRINKADVPGSKKGDVDWGGVIEVFADHSDAQARADYIQGITKQLPMFSEYDYVSGNIVVRVSHYLAPSYATDYKNAAAKL
jgi:hypothetical protein